MTRQFFPGAWYADATPSGAFVVLYPNSHVVTHLGTVPLPPGESWGVGYVRCTDVGGFRFAGQAHSTENPACWEWYPEAGWISYAPPCVGVSPAIYDFSGTLHRSDGSVGSQGYRYVEHDGTPPGRLVSGDATYRYPTGVLYEYSAAADLWIGQAAYDGGGVQVLDGDTLRQLELGDGRFVRVQWSGEHVAVSFLTSAGAVIIQTTLAALRALPVVVTPEPPITVPPKPEPPEPIPPKPEPPHPIPVPPLAHYDHAKEYGMSAPEVGAIKGPGNKYARVIASDAGTGPFGWYQVRFDRDTPDDDCWFELTKPDSRHQIRHTKVDGLFGADITEHADNVPLPAMAAAARQYYLKPGNDRGILESPVLVYDPASPLIVGYFTWPDKTLAGPSFAWVAR